MISKTSILKVFFKSKVKDRTYTIIFLLIFSFFIFFAIRPSLDTIFSLRKKLDDLKKIDKEYERQVIKIIDLQKKLEIIRSELYLLSDAIPESASVNKVIDDIKQSLQKNNMDLSTMDIGKVSLKEDLTKEKMNLFQVNLETKGSFKDGLNFVKDIKNQRRLKVIKTFSIERGVNVGSESSSLKFSFVFDGYYL